jgi:HK97 family phage prohead protease
MSKLNKPTMGSRESRAFSMPDLTADEQGKTLEGHAAVFGQVTNICGCFNETIARTAFDNTDFTNVLFDVNHDLSSLPLAHSRNNTANSTLQLSVDNQGLAIRALLDIDNNPDAKALWSAVQRGDMSGMSFIFFVRNEEWSGEDTDMPTRTITDISKVIEVSAVSMPAYDGTDINARSQSALESAQKTLESARARALDSTNGQKNAVLSDDLDLERFKAELLMKI